MKGINKRIIEIEEPENEYIEKVQVFLRQTGNVRLAKSKEEAQKYASGLVCFKPKGLSRKTVLALRMGALAIACAVLIAIVMFFL